MTYAYIGTRGACLRALALAMAYYHLAPVGPVRWRRAQGDWRAEQELA